MKSFATALGAFSILLVNPLSAANTAPSQPAVDAPELSRLGPYAVGTTSTMLIVPDRLKITTAGMVSGKLPRAPRQLSLRIWYPAAAGTKGAAAHYVHQLSVPPGSKTMIDTPGIAITNAPTIKGKRFPLIVVSHGYQGWDSFLSYLTENLASKGYVVVAIDHQDQIFTDSTGFALSFGNVILDRAQDQRAVIAALIKQAVDDKNNYGAAIDADHIGLIGYSMGGFGALATAGADYDPLSNSLKQLPAEAQVAMLAKDPAIAARIKALVTIAPWGGQPANRSWSAASLANIKAPVLMIDGDQDDIVDFKQGVSWIFGSLTGTERHLLSFANARHNVGGNPVPENIGSNFSAKEYFAEPVWRGDRLNAINQHFITAFLDMTLKGDVRKAAYLDVPTPLASEAVWPASFGEQLGGKTAGDGEPKYWRGFQRRWALGLELRKLKAGEAAK